GAADQGPAPHHLPRRGTSARRGSAGGARGARGVPHDAAPLASKPARAVPAPGRGDEGGGHRERRDLVLGDALTRGRGRPPVPTGQGGPLLGARALRRPESVPEPWTESHQRLP